MSERVTLKDPDFVPMLTVYQSSEPKLYAAVVRLILTWRAAEKRRRRA